MYYLQSRYYDPELSRFISSDIFTSTGQGLLGNNMFAYCNNNPFCYCDEEGTNPVIAAAIGGGLGGALLSVVLYLNSTDDVTLWGVVGALSVGAITGALGGWAGMADAFTKMMLVFSSGIIAGTYAEATGGSFVWGTLAGMLGTYWGTIFDACELLGFDLAVVNYFFAVLSGLGAEFVAQVGQSLTVDAENSPTTPQYEPSGVGSTGGSLGSGSPTGGSGFLWFEKRPY